MISTRYPTYQSYSNRLTETYLLASKVKSKLTQEAIKNDVDLHKLVCQANLLDTLIERLNSHGSSVTESSEGSMISFESINVKHNEEINVDGAEVEDEDEDEYEYEHANEDADGCEKSMSSSDVYYTSDDSDFESDGSDCDDDELTISHSHSHSHDGNGSEIKVEVQQLNGIGYHDNKPISFNKLIEFEEENISSSESEDEDEDDLLYFERIHDDYDDDETNGLCLTRMASCQSTNYSCGNCTSASLSPVLGATTTTTTVVDESSDEEEDLPSLSNCSSVSSVEEFNLLQGDKHQQYHNCNCVKEPKSINSLIDDMDLLVI